MDYDSSIKNDKRSFCIYFVDKLKVNQIILNTFYTNEPLKQKTIKILLFILNIILYLFINALLFYEKYISEIYRSNEEEKFLFYSKIL